MKLDRVPLVVAVDFDGTYTAAPLLFEKFIQMMLEYGWVVIFVTARGKHHRPTAQSIIQERFGGHVPVIEVHGHPGGKMGAALEAGYDVGIWIEDEPWKIVPTEEKKEALSVASRQRSALATEAPEDLTFGEYIQLLRSRGLS